MKTKISQITKLSLFVLLFVFFGFKTVSAATWNFYGYAIPYTVVTENMPPTAYAGVDRNITSPTNSVTISGASAYDSDGTITSTIWSQTSGSSATITNGSTLTPTFSNLSIGSYTFRLTATDDSGANNWDEMIVTVGSVSGISGTLTISPNSCVIASNQSTCTVTGATWTTSGATSPSLVDANTGNVLSTLANNSTPLEVYVAYPSTTYYLKDGSTTLDTKGATASCAFGTSWGGSSCIPSIVNGVCAVTHFNCNAGTSTNNAGTGPWTWNCVGQKGGSTASCFEDVGGGGGGGKPQCSDGNDNDSDGFTDDRDPGCHSDKDPNNDTSYLPNKTSERDTIKIKEKEI